MNYNLGPTKTNGTGATTSNVVITNSPNFDTMNVTSGQIFSLMSKVMKDIGPVTKDQTNTIQNFKFRGIDQFVNALHPALVRHGIFLTTDVVEEKHELKEVTRSNGKTGVDKHVHLKVRYTFWAPDGSSVSSTLAAEGLDSGDKATNKALSAALKYALIQTFMIPTTDMEDGDSSSPEIGATKTSKVSNVESSSVSSSSATSVSTKRSSFKKASKTDPRVISVEEILPKPNTPDSMGFDTGWEN